MVEINDDWHGNSMTLNTPPPFQPHHLMVHTKPTPQKRSKMSWSGCRGNEPFLIKVCKSLSILVLES